jgi:hypothetical protein
LKTAPANGATDTPPPDIAPLFSRRSDIGGGCCVSATAFCPVPKRDGFFPFFSGLFRRLLYFAPNCAGSRGVRCGHQGESPADLMAATE